MLPNSLFLLLNIFVKCIYKLLIKGKMCETVRLCNYFLYKTHITILQHGADVNVTNDRGDTPLHNAAR